MQKTIQIATLLLPCALLAPLPAATAPAPPARVQDDDPAEKPDKRPEVKELVEQLKGHAKKRGKQDREAIEVIDKLVQEFPESGLKDRGAIVKAIGGCLKEKRKDTAEGLRDNQLYIAAAYSLGEMGPESVKPLSSWIDHKSHRRDLDLQRRLILSLGKTKDDDAVKPLTDLLTHREPTVMAASAEALGNFDGLELKERKDVFNEVLKVLSGAKTQVDMDLNDSIARERYDVIAAPMITTLQLLSGHDARTPEDWTKWWNKNKKKDWDKVD